MKKQRNLSYNISILAFLFVISSVMVTSSPFQMLLNVNPMFNSNLLFPGANAADDEENLADVQDSDQDVKDEEPEQEIGSFEALGGSDETDQEDVKDEEPEQEIGSFEALGGSDETDQEDVKDEEPEQEIGSFEALGGSDETNDHREVILGGMMN